MTIQSRAVKDTALGPNTKKKKSLNDSDNSDAHFQINVMQSTLNRTCYFLFIYFTFSTFFNVAV